MSKDTSLKEIDVLKLIMFVLAFLLACVLVTVLLIVPSIKEYKKQKNAHHISLVNLGKMEQVYNVNAQALNEFRIEHARELNAINNTFNAEKFLEGAHGFFEQASLSKLADIDDNTSFSLYELNVTAKMNTPQQFYNFIDFLNNYENIILLDFPVNMNARDAFIDTSFNIKVLKSKIEE